MDTTIRQWCFNCQAATISWTDAYACTHCSVCDPPGRDDDR